MKESRRATPSVQPCCTRDGGWPPGAAVQVEASNRPPLLRLRGVVVSRWEKAGRRSGQVWIAESNASEPLMKCRKGPLDDVKTGARPLLRDKAGSNLFTARSASGIKAARTQSGLLCGTWEPVVLMRRENRKRQNREWESTEAAHRGGVARNSEDGSVMGPERRGHLNRHGSPGQPGNREDPVGSGTGSAEAGGAGWEEPDA